MLAYFIPIFLLLLTTDFLLTRGGEVSVRKSLSMAGGYVVVALIFAAGILHLKGVEAASQFTTIFFLEQMLSIDNLLVISLIFGFFGISKRQQHTALLFGIIGAIVFRTAAILLGVALIEKLTWLLFVFAAFLIWSGIQIMRGDDGDFDPEEKAIVRWIKRTFGPSSMFLAAVLAIELSDIMFAVDSITASFSISRDAEIILAANLFAVAGLRSLYHAVAYGLSMVGGLERYIGAVLVLLGAEVFLDHFVLHVPSWATMAAVFGILALGVVVSRRSAVASA